MVCSTVGISEDLQKVLFLVISLHFLPFDTEVSYNANGPRPQTEVMNVCVCVCVLPFCPLESRCRAVGCW